jgi:hypothetical protein
VSSNSHADTKARRILNRLRPALQLKPCLDTKHGISAKGKVVPYRNISFLRVDLFRPAAILNSPAGRPTLANRRHIYDE